MTIDTVSNHCLVIGSSNQIRLKRQVSGAKKKPSNDLYKNDLIHHLKLNTAARQPSTLVSLPGLSLAGSLVKNIITIGNHGT
jgi:hypothetical protein